MEKKDKKEENTKEVASEEATQEEGKHVSLSKEDEDETTPIGKSIRKLEVINPTNKGKTKEQKVGNKDQISNMDGEWVETRMIYGAVVPTVKHPTLVEKENVKPYSKSDMVHMML